MTPPDTWEVALSAGEDKRAVWERLIQERKLGALALLRNLRNMQSAGVDEDLVLDAIRSMRTDRVLPFRFIAAARYAPQWEEALEEAMLKSLSRASEAAGKDGAAGGRFRQHEFRAFAPVGNDADRRCVRTGHPAARDRRRR